MKPWNSSTVAAFQIQMTQLKSFYTKELKKSNTLFCKTDQNFSLKQQLHFETRPFCTKPVCKPSENHISNINLTNASVFVINPKSPTEPLQIFSIVDNWHLKDWRIKCFLGEKFDWKEESNKRTCDNLTVIKTNMGQLGVMEGIGEGSEIAKVVRITCNCA